MKSTLFVALAIALTAFAGCTEKDTTPTLTEEDCAALGLVLGHKTVMEGDEAMDSDASDEAMETSEEETTENGTDLNFMGRQAEENVTSEEGAETTEDEDAHDHGAHGEELACVPAGPVAAVTLTGMPASTMAYSPVSFEWVLNTETDEELHAMDTQVRVSSESVAADALGTPDTYGDMVSQFEHQNFFDGQTYNGSFVTDVPGTYYFRAYAVVSGENLWSDEVALEVTEVQPTGTTHTITCDNGGAQSLGSCDPDDLDIVLGDAVEWANGNMGGVGSWTIHKVSGPDGQEIDTTAGGEAVIFRVPGAYVFEADGDLGNVEGSITVSVPTA